MRRIFACLICVASLWLPPTSAASPVAALEQEIGALRAVLKTQPKHAESRQRLAEIGWQLAEEIERAEAVEDLPLAKHLAGRIQQLLPDIVWRTKHNAEQKNDPRAMLALAVFLRIGLLMEADAVSSCANYRKAAGTGHPAALWRYSLCAARDNLDYGRKLLRSAADAEHPAAQHVLAETMLTSQNPAERLAAADYLKRSAAAGRPTARLLLAALYETGTVVEKNSAEAEQIYTQLAEEGSAVAQNNLGALHERNGDLEQAMNWYQKAAQQGLPVAQLNIGLLYGQDEAQFHDDCQALEWITRAADQDMERARQILADPASNRLDCKP